MLSSSNDFTPFFEITKVCNPKIIELLSNTVWGLNGPRFIHQNVAHRITSNKDNIYLCCYSEDLLIGTVVFCMRSGLLGNKEITHIYTRYFSVDPDYRGHKVGEQMLEFAEQYFDLHYSDETCLFYSYIDQKNLRSSKVAKNRNYQTVANFHTYTYSKLEPKEHKEIEIIPQKKLLELFDPIDYNTFSPHIVPKSKCFAVYRNEKLICAARFLETNWKIKSIGGISGFLLKYVASNIPYLNRIFPAKKLDFLAVDSLYISEFAREGDIENLIEHALSKYDLNIAMFWLDSVDLRVQLIDKMNLGLLEKFNNNVPANIHIKSQNLSERQKSALKSKPFYIIAADLT